MEGNVHIPAATPACVELQIVCRPSLGMNPAPTAAGFLSDFSSCAGSPNRYLTDPSDDTYLCRTVGKVIVVSSFNFSRSAAGRLLIRSTENSRSAYSQ